MVSSSHNQSILEKFINMKRKSNVGRVERGYIVQMDKTAGVKGTSTYPKVLFTTERLSLNSPVDKVGRLGSWPEQRMG